ncbi:unnamed protein product [Psylliodes chrysocephalus]|uniref:MICOS complex subunit n=1 Tax=Psylliodes chrysocephalus TaxID=3402493 RepID=A0A9P0GNQ3_9CUCU|nr:unnamed protein product [Psylliodes chrysocephala]
MFSSQILKICVVPSLAATAVQVVKTKNEPQNKEEECLMRPSELPLYTPEPTLKLQPVDHRSPQLDKIESAIRSLRVQLVKFNHEYNQYKKVGVQEFHKRKDELDWVVTYLQEENNTLPKVGAIGIGALTGLIFGLRGGYIKRTLYATIGALGIGAVCYPKEASEYGQIGVIEGKKYLLVTYNFVTGAKKDDPPTELPSLPPFPTSVTELWDSVKTSVTSLVSEKPENPDEKGELKAEKLAKSE